MLSYLNLTLHFTGDDDDDKAKLTDNQNLGTFSSVLSQVSLTQIAFLWIGCVNLFNLRRQLYPLLLLIFKVLAMMAYGLIFSVAAATRDKLIDLMRNDSTLFLRLVSDLLCSGQGQESPGARNLQDDVAQAVNILLVCYMQGIHFFH
jgi:hypothetical protein